MYVDVHMYMHTWVAGTGDVVGESELASVGGTFEYMNNFMAGKPHHWDQVAFASTSSAFVDFTDVVVHGIVLLRVLPTHLVRQNRKHQKFQIC